MAPFKIKIHPLFVLLLASSVLIGMWLKCLVLFGLVLLHELGHVAAAAALGYKIKEVEILPFGGVAKLEHGSLGWNPRHEVWIAIAGPSVNAVLLVLLAVASIAGIGSREWISYLIESNLVLAFFNLLPGLPLDGGRILRAAAAMEIGFLRATEVASRMALFLSMLMMAAGVCALWIGYIHIGMTTLGLFLFLSSWQLHKQRQYDLIRFLDAKRRMRRKKPLIQRGLVADPGMTVEEVAGEFVPDAYHMVSVYSSRQQEWRIFAEEDLLRVLFEGPGPKTTLAELL